MRPSRSVPKRLRDDRRRDTALVLVEQPHVALGRLELVADRARDYARAARAVNTVRAYRAAWADFTSWCEAAGCSSLPANPTAVALYLTEQAAGPSAAPCAQMLAEFGSQPPYYYDQAWTTDPSP